MDASLQRLLDEYNGITEQMSNGGSFDMAKLGKRRSELEPVVDRIMNYEMRIKELADNQKLLSDPDLEIRAMAEDEARRLEAEISGIRTEIEELLFA